MAKRTDNGITWDGSGTFEYAPERWGGRVRFHMKLRTLATRLESEHLQSQLGDLDGDPLAERLNTVLYLAAHTGGVEVDGDLPVFRPLLALLEGTGSGGDVAALARQFAETAWEEIYFEWITAHNRADRALVGVAEAPGSLLTPQERADPKSGR